MRQKKIIERIANDPDAIAVPASDGHPGLNHLDLRLRAGKSPRPVDLPHIGGVDAAGDVEEVGENVTDIKPGTRVVIDPTVKTPKGPSVMGVNFYGGFSE